MPIAVQSRLVHDRHPLNGKLHVTFGILLMSCLHVKKLEIIWLEEKWLEVQWAAYSFKTKGKKAASFLVGLRSVPEIPLKMFLMQKATINAKG
jgi:hypothetical protein